MPNENSQNEVEEDQYHIYQSIHDEMENYFNIDTVFEQSWFINDLSKDDCDKILLNYREAFETGTFLIRKSSDPSYLTICILVV